MAGTLEQTIAQQPQIPSATGATVDPAAAAAIERAAREEALRARQRALAAEQLETITEQPLMLDAVQPIVSGEQETHRSRLQRLQDISQQSRDAGAPETQAPPVGESPRTTTVQVGEGGAGDGPGGLPAFQQPTMTTIGTTTTSESGALSRAQSEGLIAESGALAGEEIAGKKAAGAAQDAQLAKISAIQGEWAAEQQRYVDTIGARGDAAQKRFQELDAELEQLKKEHKGKDFETLQGYDTTSKALLIIAAGFEGTAAALAGRPSNTGKIIGAAIDRDMRRQRLNLLNRLSAMRLTERQRGQALARWDQTRDEKRLGVARLAQMQLAEAGTGSKRLETRLATADAVISIKKHALGTKAALQEKGRGKTRTVTQRGLVGGGPAAAKDAGKVSKDDETAMQNIDDAADAFENSLKATRRESKGGVFAGLKNVAESKVPGSSEATALGVQEQYVMRVVKAMSGAQATDAERDMVRKGAPNFSDDRVELGRKTGFAFNPMIAKIERMAARRARTGNFAAARELAKKARDLREKKKRILGSLSGQRRSLLQVDK